MTLAALSLSAPMRAQTLARPGWAGSGMTVQTWFKHLVLYQIDPRTFARSSRDPETAPGSLKGITERLDYIRDLGVDAILLEPLVSADSTGSAAPIDADLGGLDDFDELSLQASKRGLRILLTLPHPDPALARYWLTRGVAGLYLPNTINAPANAGALQAIRKLLPTFFGQRILITDADLSASGAQTRALANELQFDHAILKLPSPPPTDTAAQLRTALEQSQALFGSGTPLIATDATDLPRSASRFSSPGHEAEAARLIAALLLLNRSVPVIHAGQELGLASPTGAAITIPWGKAPVAEAEASATAVSPAPPPAPSTPPANSSAPDRYVPYVPPVKPAAPAKPLPPDPASVAGQELDSNSVLSLYRQLIQLHHGKASVRDGEEILLHHDEANALVLVRKPSNASLATPATVVVCNLSSNPLRLPLKSELTQLHLRGSFLRSVLSPGSQAISMNLEPVTVASFSVYVGELRY